MPSKLRSAAILPLLVLLATIPGPVSPEVYPLPGGPSFKLLTWDAYEDLYLDLVALKEDRVVGVHGDVIGHQELLLPGVTAAATLEEPGNRVVVVGGDDVYELYRDDGEDALALEPWNQPSMAGARHVAAMAAARMHLVVLVDSSGDRVHCYRVNGNPPTPMISWDAPGQVQALALAELPGWPSPQVVLLTDQVLQFRTVAGGVLGPTIAHSGNAVLTVMNDGQGNPRKQVALASEDFAGDWNLDVYVDGPSLDESVETSALPFLTDTPIAMLSGDFDGDGHPDLAFKTTENLHTLENSGTSGAQFGTSVGLLVQSYGVSVDNAIPAVASFTRDGNYQIADDRDSLGGLVFEELGSEEGGGTELIRLVQGETDLRRQGGLPFPQNNEPYDSEIDVDLHLSADVFSVFAQDAIHVVVWRLRNESIGELDAVAENNFLFELPSNPMEGDYRITIPFDAETRNDSSGYPYWPQGWRYWLQTRVVNHDSANHILDASPRRMLALGLQASPAGNVTYLDLLNGGNSADIKRSPPPPGTNKRVGVIIEPNSAPPVTPGQFPHPPQPPHTQGSATLQ